MALVPCARCGNPISDRATTCPRCGKPAEIVLAELSAPTVPVTMQDSLAVRIVCWCHQHPIAIGLAIYALLAVPTLLVAFFHSDDETAAALMGLAILPGALGGLGFGIWRTLPDTSVSGKLRRVGWSCLYLLLAGIGIWLLASYRFAWYLLGAAAIGVACYLVYLACKALQNRPAKISSSWYWCGVYLGAILIGAVSMNAGSNSARRRYQAKQPQRQVHNPSSDEAIVWGKVIECGLLLLGIHIIKESSRAAVLEELRAAGRLPAESPQSSSPASSTVVNQSSLPSLRNSSQ